MFLLSNPAVLAALTELEARCGSAGPEAFILWVADDPPLTNWMAALRDLRREATAASLEALRSELQGRGHAGAAAALIGIPKAEDPRAAELLATLSLGVKRVPHVLSDSDGSGGGCRIEGPNVAGIAVLPLLVATLDERRKR